MSPKCVISEGDIMLSLTGNVGRTCLAYGENLLLNQRVAKIESEYQAFVYSFFRNDRFKKNMKSMTSSSAQQNLSPVMLSQFDVLLPNKELMDKYEGVASTMLFKIINLQKQNNVLAKMRDSLIPQLVTGNRELK